MQYKQKQIFIRRLTQIFADLLYCILLLCLIFILPGCKTISPELEDKTAAAIQEQRLYELKNINGQECIANLTKLGYDNFPQINDPNSIIVSSTPELLNKANIVIELLDSEEEYIIANLGNASNVRNLPSNSQLASAMGDINIGTFSQPPQVSNKSRAIIDIFGNSIFAILPARYSDEENAYIKYAAEQ